MPALKYAPPPLVEEPERRTVFRKRYARHVDLIPNRESDDFRAIVHARKRERRVDVTGMSSMAFKDLLVGKSRKR